LLVEIRDYRHCKLSNDPSNTEPITKRVLLQPTAEAIVKDIEELIRANLKQWTAEDVIAMEQRLLLCKENDLCLEPSVEVCLVANAVSYNQKQCNVKLPKGSCLFQYLIFRLYCKVFREF
jgi:hypothetical protein